jgi:hypothetical protein
VRALVFVARAILWLVAGILWVLATGGLLLTWAVVLFMFAGQTESEEASVQFMFAVFVTMIFAAPAAAITDHLTGGRFWPYVFPPHRRPS